MSDPFDDDDDLFDNPETLGLLEAVEERAIQASQKPSSSASKPRFSQPIRHVLAKPKARNSPNSSSSVASSSTSSRLLKKEPRPINTEPGIRGTGFGWEIGGKRSFDVDRHIDNVKKREAYWNNGQGEFGEEDESIPIDVVMDGSGKYELVNGGRQGNGNISAINRNGSADEAVITDKRRAQPSMLSESLGLNGPSSNSQQNKPTNNRKQSEDAINARRKAMAAAISSTNTSTPEPFNARQPMSRSNSASATNIITSNNHSRPINNSIQPQIPNKNNSNNNNNDQKFGTNRSLSRSVSAGAQIFNRSNNPLQHTNAIAGPSRLPTIPSQSQSLTDHGSNATGHDASEGRDSPAPPMSQGSVARAAAIELDIERRKRQELEAEIANLRAQANKPHPIPIPSQKQETVQENNGDTARKVKELQGQVWAARGEAEMIRRAQKEEHQRHLEELEKLKLALREKDTVITEKENQAKKQVENIKHQAVFSNHAAHNSAMKARPQSQRFPGASQSQYRGLPTPIRNGSPSRRRSGPNEEESTPLIKSVKGKGKASVPTPVFGGFNNAFTATPTVGHRAKRQKTADLSPQASPTKAPSPSPFCASPARSQRKSSPVLGEEEGDDGIDWGPAIGLEDQDVPIEGEVLAEDRKDERAELLYHLLNHVSLSAFQLTLNLSTEPTIYRLMSYRPPINIDGHEMYTQRCSDILKACGDPDLSFDDLVEITVNSLCDMLLFVIKIIFNLDQVSINEIAVLCNIVSLLSSSTFLFPSYVRVISQTSITEILKSTVHAIFADQAKLTTYKERFIQPTEDDGVQKGTGQRDGWYLELADRLAELAEAICFVSDTSIWRGDELVDIILGFTALQQDPYIVKRGLELFYVASRQSCHFRSLITASDTYKVTGMPNESPLVDRLSRYLINPLSSASESESLQMSLLTIRGLCMLSISHPDAVIIMGQKSVLVPALIIVLQRESTKLYGIHGVLQPYKDALSLLLPTLSLLHHLVFPCPISPAADQKSKSLQQSASQGKSALLLDQQDPQAGSDNSVGVGIDLPERINSACQTREFNGLQHMFVSSLGSMSYAQIDDDIVDEVEQRGIQTLSGDLLENVVEGPEGDAIYELYVPLEEDEDVPVEDLNLDENENDDDDGNMDIDDGNDDDMEIYHQMKERQGQAGGGGGGGDKEIIEIDD